MKELGVLLVGVALLLAPVVAPAATPDLSEQAQTLIDYLLDDWNTHMHSTGIALGMQNLGMEPDDGVRLEVADHFRANTGMANNLQFWGANNYILSTEEKQIAKQIINTFDAEGSLPARDRLAEDLSIPAQRLEERMAFMTRAGLLTSSTAAPGYGLAERYASWGGPLRYNFHTITTGDQQPFDVW